MHVSDLSVTAFWLGPRIRKSLRDYIKVLLAGGNHSDGAVSEGMRELASVQSPQNEGTLQVPVAGGCIV